MYFFNPEIRIKQKVVSHHPWEKTIKDAYAGKVKYAHNSIKNPHYPKNKEKEPNPDRVKFTIIGNRTTKEFIYCVKLVTGMHKYRWKSFDSPVIRAVTSIEWPTVWKDLKIQHGGLAYCLKSQVAVLINGKFLGGDLELKELIQTKYIYHICPDYYNEAVGQFASFIRSSGLYSEIVPNTSENFLRLCNTNKGGYGGTPIHRIVKDGWIQCGGFGLKNSDLDCENFIIPHDRRGVLCMANDGRHTDCSTQFFVLLQPAPWMAHKYVAFGQLIESEETLKKIENVPTWYESPKCNIVIHKAGIFNMECQDIIINKGAKEYIQGHIENLYAIGELFYEALIEKVFLEAELRHLERLQKELKGEEEEVHESPDVNIHETKRFLRKKEDIHKQLEKSQIETHHTPSVKVDENNEFDVDEYDYEPEEYAYQHVSIAATVSVVVKPEKPFYIPLTDVPYPGEVDSTYDLKRLLRGDYCLESDLEIKSHKNKVFQENETFPSDMFNVDDEDSVQEEESLESDDEREIRRYLKMNVDHVSFAGGIIKKIAKTSANLNIFINARKSELLSDEELRQLRLAAADEKCSSLREKKVSISVPTSDNRPTKIQRRQTGFIRPRDLDKIDSIKKYEYADEYQQISNSEVDMSRKVRIVSSAGGMASQAPGASLRPRAPPGMEPELEVTRQSVLVRLYDDVKPYDDEPGPTLKDYKPIAESHAKKFSLLTYSPNTRIKFDEGNKEGFIRPSITVEDDSYSQVLNLQHGKKVARKISSDYVKTIGQIEHKLETSLRSVEYARKRPTMSVTEYQMKNQKYQEELKKKSQTKMAPNIDNTQSIHGLRMPGDSPLYSQIEVLGIK